VVLAVAEAVPVGTLVRRDFDQVHVFPGTG
jgi:hypothetical protein